MDSFINIYGPSGSGKTQFIINNLFKNINLFERLSTKYERRPAVSILPLPDFDDTVETYFYIFDNARLENIRLTELIGRLMDISAAELRKRNYQSLSAGEKRRVDLIRCAITSDILIIDEPFSNSSSDFQVEILAFLKSNFRCVVMLSHSEIIGLQNFAISDLIADLKIAAICRSLFEDIDPN